MNLTRGDRPSRKTERLLMEVPQPRAMAPISEPRDGGGTPQRADLQLLTLWRYILKRKNTLLAFLFTVLTTVLVASALQARSYRSTAVIQVEPQAPKILQAEDATGYNPRNNYDTEVFYETQYQILRSRSLAELVIEKYTQAGHPDFLDLKDPVKTFIDDYYVLEPVKGSQLIKIHMTASDPENAALLANLLAETYIKENLLRRVTASKEAEEWLENQIRSARSQREAKDIELLDFKKSHDVVSVEERYNTVLKSLSVLNESYSNINAQRVAAEGSLAQLESLYRTYQKAGRETSLAVVFDSELLRSLMLEDTRLDQEYQELSVRYKDQHPKMLRLIAQREDVKSKIDAEISRQMEGRRDQYKMLKAQEDALANELETTKGQAMELATWGVTLNLLGSEQGTHQRQHETLESRAREIQLQAVTEANNARIIDSAVPVLKAVKPRMAFNALLGLVVGLVGGVGMVLLLEYLDNTIKSEGDVEEYLGLPCLGIIPSLASSGVVVPEDGIGLDLYTLDNPKSTAAECCRSIRTNIQFIAQSRGGMRSLLVTSSNQREGKSATTMRLAISMVQAGQRICIIDSDLRRPRLHKAFGVTNHVGLTSYLAGDSSVDAILQKTSLPGLSLISSGPLPPHPAELLGSPRMRQLMQELLQRYDRILLDSPPAVVISDAVILSQMVDGVIFVVKSNNVPRTVVQAAVRRLRDVNAPLVGVVVNDINLDQGSYGYNYYYYQYYQYNYGYSPEEESKDLLKGA